MIMELVRQKFKHSRSEIINGIQCMLLCKDILDVMDLLIQWQKEEKVLRAVNIQLEQLLVATVIQEQNYHIDKLHQMMFGWMILIHLYITRGSKNQQMAVGAVPKI